MGIKVGASPLRSALRRLLIEILCLILTRLLDIS